MVNTKGLVFSRYNNTLKLLRKLKYESILLISGSSLFQLFIAYGKKEFLTP